MPAEISDEGFTAQWDEVPGAMNYNVELWNDNELLERHDSVQGLELRFDGLSRGDQYVFRVQPLADDYLNGEWSESGPIQIQGNSLLLSPESERLVRVFNIGGQFVTECYADEISRLGLRSGIYLICPMDGEAPRKILIK